MTPSETINNIVLELLNNSDSYLVSFKVKPTNNYKIYIDSDTGFSLEKSIKINRQLRKQIDELNLYPEGNYSLEVSSPGIDEPLILKRQYVKNIGRLVEVVYTDKEIKPIVGRLKDVEDNVFVIETEDKKKKMTALHTIPFDQVKTTTVQIEF